MKYFIAVLLLAVAAGEQTESQSASALKGLGAKVDQDKDGNIVLVNLSQTRISNVGLRHLQGLTKLKVLFLTNTQVTNDGVLRLKGLTGLEQLYVNRGQVEDSGLQYLKQELPNCKVHFIVDLVSVLELKKIGAQITRDAAGIVIGVNMNDTDNSNFCLQYLRDMKGLKSLDIGGTNVTGPGLKQLTALTQLERLNLYSLKIDDADLAHLQTMTSLKVLDLADTPIKDAGVAHLKGLTNLERLYLDNVEITDTAVEDLKGLTKLRELWLMKTFISEAGVAKLKEALPNCKISWAVD
ncbi:MAG TPA: hypothetical protein EYN03_09465 [Planctomycetes bacterium]|nr:hypothetical protein [Planctomycetota bacterium]